MPNYNSNRIKAMAVQNEGDELTAAFWSAPARTRVGCGSRPPALRWTPTRSTTCGRCS